MVNYYRAKGHTDEWIKQRLIGIVDRFKLTDIWKDGGIDKPVEFALLTNAISRDNALDYEYIDDNNKLENK